MKLPTFQKLIQVRLQYFFAKKPQHFLKEHVSVKSNFWQLEIGINSHLARLKMEYKLMFVDGVFHPCQSVEISGKSSQITISMAGSQNWLRFYDEIDVKSMNYAYSTNG